jgi:acyl-CoA thioesterase-1
MRAKAWKKLEVVFVTVLACTIAASHSYARAGLTQKANSRRKPQPTVYLALGDSTGVGIGAEHGGYVARIFTRIERIRPGARLINLCARAATTDDVLRKQIDKFFSSNDRPTLITLGIGANDLIYGVKAEQFARNYEEIIRRLREKTDAPLIVMNIPDLSLAPAVPAYLRDAARHHIITFNAHITVIAKRYGIPVLDLYGQSYEFSLSPEFFSTDGLHPSDAGYEFWANILWPFVQEIINNHQNNKGSRSNTLNAPPNKSFDRTRN